MQESYIRNMTWSYSRLKAFESCPYGWYLRYIDDAETVPQFYSSYGSFIHRILADFYTGKLQKADLLQEFLVNFSSEVQGERPSAKIVESYIAKGVRYFESFEPLPFEPVLIEDDKTFDYFGVPFRGIVDFVGKKQGKLFLVDHKSRDLKPRSKRKTPTALDYELDEMLCQLYIYSERIRQEFGVFPDYLCFNCFKNGAFIQEPFDPEAFERAKRWVKRMVDKIQHEQDFPPDLEYFRCRNLCDTNKDCCYYEMR